jgi:hypothetical protein
MLRRVMFVALALGLVAPATASAAKPTVTTGGVSNRTPTSVTLNGRVDPNKKDTTYFFQIGTTRLYGVNTAETGAGAGANPSAVSVPVAGLAPSTLYHYRLVARNADGLSLGKDRTFRTRVQPLGVTLAATPNPIVPGGSATLAGQLTGTNNAGRQIVLYANAFPYTAGFAAVGNPQVTAADGSFSFPVLSVPVTTQYLVQMPSKPEVTSPIVVLGAAVQVRTDTKKVERHRHSVSVRFRGTVSPATDGARVDIQKLRGGVWTTIAHTRSKHDSATRSEYSTRVRLYRSGEFRVVAESATGAYVAGIGRTVGIKVRR